MRAYNVSKKCNDPADEKTKCIEGYDMADLLYVFREIEKNPRDYEEFVKKQVIGRLYEMGVMCI